MAGCLGFRRGASIGLDEDGFGFSVCRLLLNTHSDLIQTLCLLIERISCSALSRSGKFTLAVLVNDPQTPVLSCMDRMGYGGRKICFRFDMRLGGAIFRSRIFVAAYDIRSRGPVRAPARRASPFRLQSCSVDVKWRLAFGGLLRP